MWSHQKEMGGDGREQPFFFTKSRTISCPRAESALSADDIQLPLGDRDVAVVGTGGYKIPAAKANDHVWGYAVGLDMTRRDLAAGRKDKGRPWTFGKDFDQSAPVGPIIPASKSGHPKKASSGSR